MPLRCFLCLPFWLNFFFDNIACVLLWQAESTKRPRDVYQFLEMRGVGGCLALLYETWAASAFKAAEHDDVAQILTRGIEKYGCTPAFYVWVSRVASDADPC